MSMMLYKVESLPGRGEEKVVYKLVLIFGTVMVTTYGPRVAAHC